MQSVANTVGWLLTEWTTAGRILELGKYCLRFKRVDELALDVLAKAIKRAKVRDHWAR